jgi:thioredoxin-dependent peroxiredoxin
VGAVVLTISPQDVDSHARWAEHEGFQFAMLADTEGVVAKAYGVYAAKVGVKRSVFVIDEEGILRWRYTGMVRAIFKKPRALARVVEGI